MIRLYAYDPATRCLVPFCTKNNYDTGEITTLMLKCGYAAVIAMNDDTVKGLCEEDIKEQLDVLTGHVRDLRPADKPA